MLVVGHVMSVGRRRNAGLASGRSFCAMTRAVAPRDVRAFFPPVSSLNQHKTHMTLCTGKFSAIPWGSAVDGDAEGQAPTKPRATNGKIASDGFNKDDGVRLFFHVCGVRLVGYILCITYLCGKLGYAVLIWW